MIGSLFEHFSWVHLKLTYFVYTYCQQPYVGSCYNFRKRSQYERS